MSAESAIQILERRTLFDRFLSVAEGSRADPAENGDGSADPPQEDSFNSSSTATPKKLTQLSSWSTIALARPGREP
jgi:hypothetical protein